MDLHMNRINGEENIIRRFVINTLVETNQARLDAGDWDGQNAY